MIVEIVALTPSPPVSVLSNNNLSLTLYPCPPASTWKSLILVDEYLLVAATVKDCALPPRIVG